MYRVYDYECEICDKREERLVKCLDTDMSEAQRCDCGQWMHRLVSATHTTFKFNDRNYKK